MTAFTNLYLSLVGRKPNSKTDQNRLLIYLNIRVSGLGTKRLSTGISIPKSNFKNGGFTGRIPVVVAAEKQVASLKDKVTNSYSALVSKGTLPLPDLIIENMISEQREEMTLMGLADVMIRQKKDAVKNAQATAHLVEKFTVMKTQISDFLKLQLDKKDVYLYDVNYDFLNKFVAYLKFVGNGNYTINKKVSNFGQFFRYAIKNGWALKDPTNDWKPLPTEDTNNEFLTPDQFKTLLAFKLPNETFEVVKDSFIFMAMTGLSFADMKKFNMAQIKDVDSIMVLEYKRTKLRNNKFVKVPLVELVLSLANKHYMKKKRSGKRDFVEKTKNDPVFDAQSMNIYNQKIKDLFAFNSMQLDFIISSHCARKTFGNLINKKSNIGNASTLLGHSSVGITERSYVDNAADHLLQDKFDVLKSIADDYNFK